MGSPRAICDACVLCVCMRVVAASPQRAEAHMLALQLSRSDSLASARDDAHGGRWAGAEPAASEASGDSGADDNWDEDSLLVQVSRWSASHPQP